MAQGRVILQHPELEGGPFYWKAGSVGVLLLHGLTATTAEVRPLAKYLHERGYTVAGPLLPGHGTTPVDLSSRKWKDWVDAAEVVYQKLCLDCQKVLVAGESMGAMLALYLASQHADIPGLMIYAPALHIPGIGRARYLAPFIREIRKKVSDQKMLWQGYYVNSLAAVVQLYQLQLEVRRRLPDITIPVMIVQGRLDKTIDPLSAEMVYDMIGSKRKTLYWMEHSGHVILLDREFDRVAELTLAFIQSAQLE